MKNSEPIDSSDKMDIVYETIDNNEHLYCTMVTWTRLRERGKEQLVYIGAISWGPM